MISIRVPQIWASNCTAQTVATRFNSSEVRRIRSSTYPLAATSYIGETTRALIALFRQGSSAVLWERWNFCGQPEVVSKRGDTAELLEIAGFDEITVRHQSVGSLVFGVGAISSIQLS